MNITILNELNLAVSAIIVVGTTVWLWQFSASYIKHRDSVGLFLVFMAASMMIQNALVASLQLSQVSGAFSSGMGVFPFAGRLVERFISLALMIGMFILSRSDGD